MKTLLTSSLLILLSACSSVSDSGSSQMYGEIKTGIETSRTTVK
ncbi:hypothetical protein [Neisseria sp.]